MPDHHREVLARTPGALPVAAAVAQARGRVWPGTRGLASWHRLRLSA